MKKDIRPQDIINEHLPHVQKITQQLRKLIKQTIPEASEKAYPTWHGIGYRHPKAGYFVGIFPKTESVKIYFEHGDLLKDEDGLFTGGGKQTRQIEFRKIEDLKPNPLKKLLKSATRLKLDS